MIRFLLFVPVILIVLVGWLLVRQINAPPEPESTYHKLIATRLEWQALLERRRQLLEEVKDRNRVLEDQHGRAQALETAMAEDPSFEKLNLIKEAIRSVKDYAKQAAEEGKQMIKNFELKEDLVRHRPAVDFHERIRDLNNRVNFLDRFQKSLVERAVDYNKDSLESALGMKASIENISDQLDHIANVNNPSIAAYVRDMRLQQVEMIQKIKEQSRKVAEFNEQLKEKIAAGMERINDLMERNKIKLADMQQKAEQQKEMVQEQLMDQRAVREENKVKLEGARQKARDIREALKDHGK